MGNSGICRKMRILDSDQKKNTPSPTTSVRCRQKSSMLLSRLATRAAPRGAVARFYNVSTTLTGGDACKSIDLDAHGITGPTTVYRNLTFDELHEHEIANAEGAIAKAEYGDTFAVDTGKFTGRSPADKWTVRNVGAESDGNMWWGPVNKPMEPAVFDELYEKAVAYFNTLDSVYVADLKCGANPETQIKVRFLHQLAWQQHFVTNMFIRPESAADLAGFLPTADNVDFTVINACALVNENWERHGLNSDVAVAFNLERKVAVIFGTWSVRRSFVFDAPSLAQSAVVRARFL